MINVILLMNLSGHGSSGHVSIYNKYRLKDRPLWTTNSVISCNITVCLNLQRSFIRQLRCDIIK